MTTFTYLKGISKSLAFLVSNHFRLRKKKWKVMILAIYAIQENILIFSVRLLFNHALMKMDESGELQRIIGWTCLPLSLRLDLNKICQLHFSTPHPYHWIHTIAGNTRQWFLTARGQKDVPLDFQGVNKNYIAHHFNTPTCVNCPVSSGVRRHLMVVMVVMMVMGRKDKTDI